MTHTLQSYMLKALRNAIIFNDGTVQEMGVAFLLIFKFDKINISAFILL